MRIETENATTEHGSGVSVHLDGKEVATAIDAWLTAHGIRINGPKTIMVNGQLCEQGHVHADSPSYLEVNGEKISGHENCPPNSERDSVDANLLALQLRSVLEYAEQATCLHEETHRGGAIWEICDYCGAKWADDEGGKPASVHEYPKVLTDARDFLHSLQNRYATNPVNVTLSTPTLAQTPS